jgi:sugar lactone lactonase YvrE
MKQTLACLALVALVGVMMAGCDAQRTATIGVNLPDHLNTPDGLTTDKDGSLILSIGNFNNETLGYSDDKYPSKMVRITKAGKIVELITLPKHPETGKPSGPLGVDIGPDGHLYIADNQAFTTNDYKSRLLRVIMKDGKAVKVEVLVTGFIMSNAVACQGDSVYVTETRLDPAKDAYPLPSGVYRFKLSELDPAKPIKLGPMGTDPHLVTKIFTYNKAWAVGANGMGFSPDGKTMYVCNFGEKSIVKFAMEEGNPVGAPVVVAQGQGIESTDGMKVDTDGMIYVADFVGNAVHKVNPATGKVTTLAAFPKKDNTGANGEFDKCSEVGIMGDKIYVSNIDLPFDGNKTDKPYTVSVIDK